MDGTREIVDPSHVGLALAILMGVGVVATFGLVLAVRRSGSAASRKAAIFAAALIPGYPMWVVYNAIEDALGLDSVAALLLNLVLFLAVGVAGGLLGRRFWPEELDQPPSRQERQVTE